jgi:RsiW-degrading membrane proteinase PrsW (M82 family)
MNNELKKILKSNGWLVVIPILINLIFILPYPYPPKHDNYHVVLPSFGIAGLFILLMAVVNFILSVAMFITRDKTAIYYLLAAAMTMLIGFSVCSLP